MQVEIDGKIAHSATVLCPHGRSVTVTLGDKRFRFEFVDGEAGPQSSAYPEGDGYRIVMTGWQRTQLGGSGYIEDIVSFPGKPPLTLAYGVHTLLNDLGPQLLTVLLYQK